MQLMDYLRFHIFEAVFGIILTVGGLYKIVTYIAPPENLPYFAPFSDITVFWFTAICGALTLVWSLVSWNKHRVR